MSQQDSKTGIKIVKVESRFSRMALRDGGVAAEDAIAAATAFIESQRSRYFDWVAADLLALADGLKSLHDSNGGDSGYHDAAYYKAAQIRDLGGTFGYQVITETADSLCELLYRLRSAGRYSREAIETHMEAMKMVCARDVETMPDTMLRTLLQGLHMVVEKFPRPQLPADDSEPAAP